MAKWTHPTEFIQHESSVKINNLGYTVHFVFTNNIQKAWLSRFNTDATGIGMLHEAAGIHSVSTGGHSYIILPWDVGVQHMVHECWHAVYAMLQWAGIPLDNNELVAYTLGFIISEGQTAQIRNDIKLGRTKKCKTPKRTAKSLRLSTTSAKAFSSFKPQSRS